MTNDSSSDVFSSSRSTSVDGIGQDVIFLSPGHKWRRLAAGVPLVQSGNSRHMRC